MAGIGVHDARNRCSASVGIGVHVRPESAFTMSRNPHFRQRHETDAQSVEIIERQNQMAQAATEPIQLPYY
jgi:hypothetical protein